MNIIGVIPARMASTRFPGKPLAKINGVPMVGHVYQRSKMSKILQDVYVATPDKEISDYIKSIGGRALMTKETHPGASDRTAEAMDIVEREQNLRIDIVLMIQGDEPMIRPEALDSLLEPMIQNPTLDIVNLAAQIRTDGEHTDANIVKVVADLHGFALYFSREPIPSAKKFKKEFPKMKQTGIIAFRRDYLLKFGGLQQTPLEIIESVDMLRVLENGDRVKIIVTDDDLYSVDTDQDLIRVEQLMKGDDLQNIYR